jgi:hypothetical protein
MTRRLLQRVVGLALAVGIGVMVIPTKAPLLGQTSAESRNAGQRLEGTWMVTITRINAPPPLPPTFLSLQTYTPNQGQGGESGEMLEESNTSTIRSVAHGDWVRTGPRRFTRIMTAFRFDSTRTFVGFSRGTSELRLNPAGDRFRAEGSVERFDTTGRLVSIDSGGPPEVGKRCTISTRFRSCLGIK